MKAHRINLMPKDMLPQYGFRGEHGLALLFTGLLSYVAISMPLLSNSAKKSQAQLAIVESENAKLKNEYNRVSQEELPKNSVEAQRVQYKKLLDKRSYWGQAFKELSLLSVPNISLSKLKSRNSDKKASLNIEGLALSSQEVSSFFSILEKSYFFRNVRLEKTERIPGLAPKQFSFAFSIELPEKHEGEGG